MQFVKRSLDGLSAEDRRYYFENALATVRDFDPSHPEVNNALRSIEGTMRVLYLGLRPAHPQLTIDDVAIVFSRMTGVERDYVMATFADQNLRADDSDPKANPPATQAKSESPSTGGAST